MPVFQFLSTCTTSRKRCLVWLFGAAIFALGLLVGIGSTMLYHQSRQSYGFILLSRDSLSNPQREAMFLRRLNSLLDLSQPQQARIGQLLEQTRDRLSPTVIRELKGFNAEVERELTPRQLELWRAELARYHDRK